MSMPPGSAEGAARAEQAARGEEIEIESVPPKAGRQAAGPDATITLVATAPLRRPTPWLKIVLIAGGLCAAAAGWRVYRVEIADHETAARSGEELAQERLRRQELERQLAARQGERDAPAQERARLEQQPAADQNDQRVQAALARSRTIDQAIEQQVTGRRDQDALVWERARSKELEHRLAVHLVEKEALAKERAHSKILEQQLADRQGDQDALAKERTRRQELEQQLAVLQGDQEALVQERARSLALERELMKHRYPTAIPLPEFELIPTWPALDSITPARPAPAAREAMPAAPIDKPAAEADKPAAEARD
jgi:hypothetical protein